MHVCSHDNVHHTRNLLKARDAIGRGNHPCDDFSTPYIFADLLRMWIEGLPGHLIPDEYLYPTLFSIVDDHH